MKKIVLKTQFWRAINLGFIEQCFFEEFYPQKEMQVKTLMSWASEISGNSLNYNKIYAIRRAIMLFCKMKDNNIIFEIDWQKVALKDIEINKRIKEKEAKK